jgi:hypothetical protein
MGKFWKDIAKEISKQTNQPPRTNLSRNVTVIIKDRKEFLESLASSEEDSPTSYTDAIDAWIGVVDAYQQEKEDFSEAQGRIDSETAVSNQWRANQLSRYSDKTTLVITNKQNKRSRGQEGSEEEEEGEEEGEEEEEGDTTPQPSRRRIRQKVQKEKEFETVLSTTLVNLTDYLRKQGASQEVVRGDTEVIKEVAKEAAKEAVQEVVIGLTSQMQGLQDAIEALLNRSREG